MKRYFHILVLILAFTECKSVSDEKKTPPVRQSDETFQSFFSHFSTDSVYQLQRVYFPLPFSSIDIDDKLSKDTILKQEWQFIPFVEDSAASQREIDAFKGMIENKAKDTMLYKRQGIDNGILVEYYFQQKNGKWYLVTIVDKSS